MIHEMTGDILLSDAHVIAHGVSPNDDFHQGLALQLRESLPEMYKAFRHYCQTMHPKPGTLMAWRSGQERVLAHLFTQAPAYDHGSKPGRASVSDVNHALHALRNFVQKESVASVALPRLACGVGGLEWQEVRPLISRHLGDLGVPVYVYVNYNKNMKAQEPK
ncbi:MAG: macro domain-containing protein [Nitrosomonadales bacterium]|nr:macro domain-containing protein [Nitrosomonadales bacterium]